MVKQHKKIDELKIRSTPVTLSGSYVDALGNVRELDFKIQASETDRIIKGYLIVWGVRDTYGTAFVKGCCARSIRERGPESSSKMKIAHLWQHDIKDPIGRFLVLREDDYGLYFEAEYDDVPQGDRALKQIRSGTLNQFSVGFDYIYDMLEYDESTNTVMLYEVRLMEGSVVTFGSNEETFAYRSAAQMVRAKEELIDDTDFFINQLPKEKQLELRSLINRHVNLAVAKPAEESQEQRTQDIGILQVGDYKLNMKEFTN